MQTVVEQTTTQVEQVEQTIKQYIKERAISGLLLLDAIEVLADRVMKEKETEALARKLTGLIFNAMKGNIDINEKKIKDMVDTATQLGYGVDKIEIALSYDTFTATKIEVVNGNYTLTAVDDIMLFVELKLPSDASGRIVALVSSNVNTSRLERSEYQEFIDIYNTVKRFLEGLRGIVDKIVKEKMKTVEEEKEEK